MGVFRRARDTKSLAGRRTAAAADVQDALVLPITLVTETGPDEVTTEIPSLASLPSPPSLPSAKTLSLADAQLASTGVNARVDRGEYDADDDSDVFVARASAAIEAPVSASSTVTLFVYGWDQVQPGPLSWVFPSLRTALDAVKTMRNAVEWCICSGESWDDVDSARAEGAVLIEQLP